eukprot:gnl/TRDRNA2_/TRDRNA2_92912_c0_seq1.p1 gnl/TRDRNA2_/TRDRNA2_92912_c0~~gnl/TRDRNA2_/TRDRNA2_92912_c0_seq1.p1  ORF type:complete len:133 (+),score=21.50 gnl/TRDRNA2_/TRDRNA2_92912_c0_seq1:80-478(+)
MLVLDEAQRILDIGLEPQIRDIANHHGIPRKEERQNCDFVPGGARLRKQLKQQLADPPTGVPVPAKSGDNHRLRPVLPADGRRTPWVKHREADAAAGVAVTVRMPGSKSQMAADLGALSAEAGSRQLQGRSS